MVVRLLIVAALWLGGCDGDEPVITPMTKPETPGEVRERREAAERRTNPDVVQADYRKADGVYIDVPLFGGRRYSAIRDEIEAQLGPVRGQKELSEGLGKELGFERATVRTLDDVIYLVDVPLPEPMRRDRAMLALGFPGPAPRGYTEYTLEFRANNVWEFRRLRFIRAAVGDEDVVRVECWKKQPGD
jgi:hypothetical protein